MVRDVYRENFAILLQSVCENADDTEQAGHFNQALSAKETPVILRGDSHTRRPQFGGGALGVNQGKL